MRALLLWWGLSIAVCGETWTGPVGPIRSVRLTVTEHGSALLEWRERMSGQPERWAQALGFVKESPGQLQLFVEDVQTSDQQREFLIETPHKGIEGVPRLRVTSGESVSFGRQGDALILQRADGLDLKLFLQQQ